MEERHTDLVPEAEDPGEGLELQEQAGEQRDSRAGLRTGATTAANPGGTFLVEVAPTGRLLRNRTSRGRCRALRR